MLIKVKSKYANNKGNFAMIVGKIGVAYIVQLVGSSKRKVLFGFQFEAI